MRQMGAPRALKHAPGSSPAPMYVSPRSRANAWLADLSDFPDSGEKVLMLSVEGDEQEPIAIFLAGRLLTRPRHGDRGAWLSCHCSAYGGCFAPP